MKSFDIVDRSKAPTTTKYTPRKVTIDAHVLADAAVTLEGLDAELASLAREVPRARFRVAQLRWELKHLATTLTDERQAGSRTGPTRRPG